MAETRFHMIEIGSSDGEQETTHFYVAPENIDARKIMAGAEPTAVCSNAVNATLIVNALNEFLTEAA